MKLATTIASEGPGTPIVLTHGLYGHGRNLGVVARQLAGRQVVLVDQRNHGDSPWDDRHDYPALAEDMAGVLDMFDQPADLVGHSMGGKAAMATALLYPHKIRRLVVMDIAPITYSHTQREYAEAMLGLDLTGLSTRSEADKRLSAALPQAGLRAFFLQSLDLRSNPPRWKLNLDVLLRNMDVLTGWPDDLPKGGFTGPTLFIHGAQSDYIDAAGRKAALQYFPQAQFKSVERAGHWLHAERPKETAAAIAEFLRD